MNGVQRKEYSVKVVGGVQLRLDAMRKDKRIAATMLNLPYSLLADRDGMQNLGMAVQALGSYQGTAAFALRSWASANQETVVRYIQAYVEGLRGAKNKANKAEAAALLVKRLKMGPDVAAQCCDILVDPGGGFAPDAVLLDVIMPEMDGFEFLESVRKSDLLKSSKIIILSNRGQKEDIDRGLSFGVDDYIVKAYFTPTEIVQKVKTLLENKKATVQ